MLRLDRLRPRQIRYRARDLQNPIIRPRAQPQTVNRQLHQLLSFCFYFAIPPHHPRAHLRVAVDLRRLGKTLGLHPAALDHPRPDGSGGFAIGPFIQLIEGDGGDFDVQVDAVEQRAGDFGEVALDVGRCAYAFAVGIGEVAARAGLRSLLTTLRYQAGNPSIRPILR